MLQPAAAPPRPAGSGGGGAGVRPGPSSAVADGAAERRFDAGAPVVEFSPLGAGGCFDSPVVELVVTNPF
jgi:hypothetical protein